MFSRRTSGHNFDSRLSSMPGRACECERACTIDNVLLAGCARHHVPHSNITVIQTRDHAILCASGNDPASARDARVGYGYATQYGGNTPQPQLLDDGLHQKVQYKMLWFRPRSTEALQVSRASPEIHCEASDCRSKSCRFPYKVNAMPGIQFCQASVERVKPAKRAIWARPKPKVQRVSDGTVA